MNYQASLSHLSSLFLKHDFKGHQVNNRKHAVTTEVDRCQNGSIISITFPGYKATSEKPDYRVDITRDGVTTSLSHANIIVDIFNKCINGGMSIANLGQALQDQAGNCALDYTELAKLLPYTPVQPSKELLAEAKAAHAGKPYNERGNSWDLTIEELFKSIKWIVIQEDINYPISKGYLGRKMPYGRYLEAIHVLQGKGHSLQEVIQRALSHFRPQKWADMSYDFEANIR
ncbi:hypothetical protein [Hymenobacter sp.]|uniref:hypothetical protein n=1 Tax=Hymenobacter sp. TaxID=1898978 RepID=UPI002869FDE2|nr:hypothetical protein [Hymenobacter sp.]